MTPPATERVTIIPDARPVLEQAGLRSFRDFMDYAGGRRVCHKRGRSTVRIAIGERAFYLKRNRFHWVEFLKGLVRLRFPVRGALREWRNIARVRESGVSTLVPIAFGERPFWGFETSSFSVTEELYRCQPLDQVLGKELPDLPSPAARFRKRGIFRQLGAFAGRLHGHGLYHQDFYLSHVFLGPGDVLHLIDLQRVLHRPWRARHFCIKDLAQLNYAASRVPGVSRTDRMRFLHAYFGCSTLGFEEKQLVRAVLAKTSRIARHDVKLLARRRRRGEIA
ncbi:lipopolysaccharide kinase InaA family protein [Syntrophotalea acetylenica]|jgi:heptose I phosphotransferase|uniref:Lipopolysaccharide core heptose(I) kinase RfaP n=1 Tax=Syntrophotalea acetylenica TaxID=29542 RepID=A0A1L3GHU6_SYNAC|nr:lipopolysaccharide kinase InaA family protein [Syntrophotalea acetylenica]APG25501.1 hypothetical protein A7E75_11070 [Syntrophotalea acetylenica]APG43566.1 hypothetical protein A6070_05080 [Syntrophotalea acetylenica]